MAKRKIKKFSWKKVVVGASVVTLLAGGIGVAHRVIDPTETVTEVIDGDTFRISNKQTIRLFNVDAPDLKYCYGVEAKEALSRKILGKKVILKSPRTDFWKRVEAYVYLDGESINEYVARNGFGADHSSGSEESFLIKDAGNLAQTEKLGIYSEKCSPSNPPKKNCVIKGHIPYNTGNRDYLLPGCQGYPKAFVERFRGEDWFCTEEEASKAGFTKSSNCHN